MSVITKKIGKGRYAYLAKREGMRVVHKYIGPINSGEAIKIMLAKKETMSIPERLKPLFWDSSLSKIHIRRNARYIIERVLEFGNMEAIEWLQRVYPVQTIIDVLYLSRNITQKSRDFWMLWFKVISA